jgi:hypothetical protein
MNAALTKNPTVRRQARSTLATLIATLGMLGAAQMIAAQTAGAWIAECSEGVACTEDTGGGGPASGGDQGDGSWADPANWGNSGSSGGSSGDQGSTLDPCYVDPGPSCWGGGDSGAQNQGSSASNGSGGSNGVPSDDWCAGWGVSCGTDQPGDSAGENRDPFGNPSDPANGPSRGTVPPPLPPHPCQAEEEAWVKATPRQGVPAGEPEPPELAEAKRRWHICLEDTQRGWWLAQADSPGVSAVPSRLGQRVRHRASRRRRHGTA